MKKVLTNERYAVMKKALSIFASLALGLAAFGGDGGTDTWTDGNGVTWTFDWAYSGDSRTATITKCNTPYYSSVTIPANVSHDGSSYVVTKLGSYVFSSCSALVEVVIPASVTAIVNYAFYNCANLEYVRFKGKVPSSCNFYSAFYNSVFYKDCMSENWNDGFSSSCLLSGASGSILGDNYLASIGSTEPFWTQLSSLNPCRTKWFSWTAPKSGTVWFHTQGSSFDTLLGVYQGTTLASLSPVTYNNNFFKGGASQVTFVATAGETYRICLGGVESERGTFYLKWCMGTPVTLSLDPNGGTFAHGEPSAVPVPKNAACGDLPTPEKTYYTFGGWYTKKSGGSKVTAKTKFKNATKLYARWAKAKFKMTVAGSEGAKKVTGSGNYAWGTKVKLTATPKSGYVFWYWGYEDEASKAAFPKYDTQYRKAQTATITVPKDSAVRYRAYFIKKTADAVSLDVIGPTTLYAEEGSGATEVYATSLLSSYPTIKASGVPNGVTVKAISGTDYGRKISIANYGSVPPGKHTIKVTATNRSGKKATKNIVVWGRNDTWAVSDGKMSMSKTTVKDPNRMMVGVAPNWDTYGIAAQDGYKISKIEGMPSGLAWDSKHQTLTGYPTQSGWYTFTFTLKKGGKKVTATSTFYVEALPAGVVGTFKGYTTVKIGSEYSYGAGSRQVTLTISKNGQISMKAGDFSISGASLTPSGGQYWITLDDSFKDKKKTRYVRHLNLAVSPEPDYYEDAASGALENGFQKKGESYYGEIEKVFVRKNVFGRNADGTAKVSEVAQKALEAVAYYYEETVVVASGKSLALKLNKDANGRLNGTVTLTGLGTGSTVLSYEGTGPVRYLVARFTIGNASVVVNYPVSYYGGYPNTNMKSIGKPSGTIWIK